MRKINLIVIHCSATRVTQNYTFDQLTKDHKKRKFRKAGYHFYIRKDGSRFIGRELDEIGAHIGDVGKNADSLGICYEGGYSKDFKPADTRTEEQKAEILATILEVLSKLKAAGQDVAGIRIVGHRDLSPDRDGDGVVEPHEWVKYCPCFDAIPEYKNVVKDFLKNS